MPHKIVAYTVLTTNVTPVSMAAAMLAVPLYTSPTQDPVLGQAMGLTVESDTPSSGAGFATRTITLNMDAASGAPFAPPTFQIHPQTKDQQVAIFSSSAEDSPLVSVVDGCAVACPVDCPPAPTIRPGIGAYTVEVTYTDAEGHVGVVVITLQGRAPVVIHIAAGTLGVAVVTSIVILTAGSLGSSVGQLTVSVLTPHGCPASTTAAVPGPCAVCGQNPSAADLLQDQLGQALAYTPNSYYSMAMQVNPTTTGECTPQPPCEPCPPCDPFTIVPAPPLPTPALLIAMLTNYFTNTLSLALSAPVVAATPVLV
jgi:hypothetical protein